MLLAIIFIDSATKLRSKNEGIGNLYRKVQAFFGKTVFFYVAMDFTYVVVWVIYVLYFTPS